MNRIDVKTSYIIATALMLLHSCAVYYPQAVDIPLIKEKGDLRINTGAFLASNLHESGDFGGQATVSYGLTNMLAVQGYLSEDVLGTTYVQGALGLFKALDNNTVMELYGGYGYGVGNNGYVTSTIDSATTTMEYSTSFQIPFVQFNIGQTDLGAMHLDYGMGLKGGYIFSYHNDVVTEAPQKNGWMVEPSIFFRFGGRIAKFTTKVNYLWTNSISDKYRYFPLSASMGVTLFLGKSSK